MEGLRNAKDIRATVGADVGITSEIQDQTDIKAGAERNANPWLGGEHGQVGTCCAERTESQHSGVAALTAKLCRWRRTHACKMWLGRSIRWRDPPAKCTRRLRFWQGGLVRECEMAGV